MDFAACSTHAVHSTATHSRMNSARPPKVKRKPQFFRILGWMLAMFSSTQTIINPKKLHHDDKQTGSHLFLQDKTNQVETQTSSRVLLMHPTRQSNDTMFPTARLILPYQR